MPPQSAAAPFANRAISAEYDNSSDDRKTCAGRGPSRRGARAILRMRSYLLIGLIFLLVIWDIAQNRGQSLRMVGNWAAGFMRAIGLL